MRSPSTYAVILLLAAGLTGGCAGPVQQGAKPDTTSPSLKPIEEPFQEPGELDTRRSIPVDTLYQLLVAEFAGIRQAYPLSLQIYYDQAFATRDQAVVARATRIASYLEASEVIDLARLWTEVDPTNPEARALSAHYLLRTGQLLAALDDALYLASLGDPTALQALAAQAENLDARELDELRLRLERAQRTTPADPELAFALALANRQIDDLPAARHWAEQTIAIEPEHEGATLLLSQLLYQQNDIDGALALLEQSLRDQGDSRRLRLQYARFLTEVDLELARDQISTLAGQYPDDLDLQYTLALVNLELGHREAAQKLLESLLDSPRHSSNAHYQLGWIAEQDGYPEIALEHYRQVRTGANLLPAIGRVTRLLSRDQGTAEARDFLRDMRSTRSNLALPLYQFEAELLLEHGAGEEAYRLLGDALREYPDDVQLLYTRFVVAERLGQLDRIESNLRLILEQEPDNPTALNALGYSLTNFSIRYEEAYQMIARALEQEPDNPAILDSMGWVHYRMGDYDQALYFLREAFEQLQDPEIAAHLGEVLWKTGAETEARQIWSQGLESSPRNPIIHETLERLDVDDL